MVHPSEIHYARTRDGLDIAYMVVGEGPDLLVTPGFVTHLDLLIDLPPFQPVLALARRFRVILFDKRGTGLSDRSLGCGSIEDRTEDMRAVLDAVGSEQAILYGISEGGPMAIYQAAAHPERVRALVLGATYAFMDPEVIDPLTGGSERFFRWLERSWGRGQAMALFVNHAPDPEAAVRVMARYERSACTPQMAAQVMRHNFDIDVRPFLPLVRVPTLVVHCKGDPAVPVALARSLAEPIPDVRTVEVDGDFHQSWQPQHNQRVADAVEDFLDDFAEAPVGGAARVGERELATVLFTDIVSSTERAAEAGDAVRKGLLDRHERAAARAIESVGGRLVETTGDGVLATFGGPSQAVTAARAVQDAGLALGVAVRAGMHTGEIERRGARIGGLGVHIAARILGLANGGEILASRTVRDLAVGSKLAFEDRGSHTLKGVEEPWQVYAVS